MRHSRTVVRFLTIALLVTTSANCSDKVAAPVIPEIETTTFASSLGIDLSEFTKTSDGVYYRDVVVGSGAVAKLGSVVETGYRLNLPSGELIDETAGGFTFTIGVQNVLVGYQLGLLGMQPGGARIVIIPPALAYGPSRVGPIPPNSILVFRIDLLSVN